MTYKLDLNTSLQIVELKYMGTVQLSTRKQARDEVFQMCRTHKISRALVDLSNSDIQMSETDAVKFASAFRDADLPVNYHLACIANPDNSIENLVQTLITIDGINVKYFLDRDEAIAWLTAF
ncbi:MAG: hypothetical protein OEX12_06925 [Gammaproteobacteria bacterium]|nr:hypothetical protein [Gammaproteobacteria bacterium]